MLSRPGLEDLYQHRLSVYDAVATLTVATDGRRPEAVSQDVLAQLAGDRHGAPGRDAASAS
jgi:shikimate kinase